jgi:hypothetical protein
MSSVSLQIEGLERVQAGLERFPDQIAKYLSYAGQEAAKDVIFPAMKYPPETGANAEPTPYYIRGRGQQIGGTRVAQYNNLASEKLGTQWYAKRSGYGTEVGNRASYAPFVVGEEQTDAMAAIGWPKFVDVVQEYLDQITEVYQAWVDKLLNDLQL